MCNALSALVKSKKRKKLWWWRQRGLGGEVAGENGLDGRTGKPLLDSLPEDRAEVGGRSGAGHQLTSGGPFDQHV